MKTIIFFELILSLAFASCSKKNSVSANQTPEIIKKVAELPEYKRAESKIDSLKKNGIDVNIQIVLVPDEIHPKDSLSLAYIEENFGFDQEQLYEIKFEKRSQKIVSVTSLKNTFVPRGSEKIETVK